MQQIKAFANYDDSDVMQEHINAFIKQEGISIIDIKYNSVLDTRAPFMVESAEWFSAVLIYEQLEGNAPESTNANIINMHKDFLRYQIAETQRTKERGNVFSVEKDIISGGLMALEAALNHIESLGVEK